MRKYFLLLIAVALIQPLDSFAKVSNSRSFDFQYKVVFKGLKDVSEDSKKLDLWLPLLPDTPYQKVEKVTISPQGIATITRDKTYHNEMIHFAFNTPIDPKLEINIQYKIKRFEFFNKPGNKNQKINLDNDQENFDKYLQSNRLVTLSPRVREIASTVIQEKETTM